jgi:hypothetical protein
MKQLKRLTLLMLLITSGALAQTPPPPGEPLTPQGIVATPIAPPQGLYSRRDIERAARDIEKALRASYQFDYLRSVNPQAPLDDELLSYGSEMLRRAQNAYAQQAFYSAREYAKAADKIYKAVEALYEAQFDPLAAMPRSRRSQRRAAEAPFKAAERIQRVELELSYTPIGGSEASLIQQLLTSARRQLESATVSLPVAHTPLTPMIHPAQSSAAEELAKAANHLLKAVRGF